MARKREYGDRVRKIEYAAFTPLVCSTSGGMRKETAIAYKHLAGLLAKKRKTQYSITLAWMRCTVLFALIYSAVTAIRGSRSHVCRQQKSDFELGCRESVLRA